MEASYKNLGYYSLLLIPLTIAAFYKTYITLFPNFPADIDIFIHLHAFISTVWIGLLIAQPFLIANKKVDFHRKAGKLSYVVFPLLILSFIPQIIKAANSAYPKNIFFSLADGTLLIIFYSLAIYNRKTVSSHMRFMITTMLVFLGPTVGRIGPILFGME